MMSNFCPNCEALARELKAIKQEQRNVSEQLGEPVAWMHKRSGRLIAHKPYGSIDEWDFLYTTPQQRTWVGLTFDEVDEGLLRSDYAFWFVLATFSHASVPPARIARLYSRIAIS